LFQITILAFWEEFRNSVFSNPEGCLVLLHLS
ncbi:hypothetical protein BAE44_0019045, partial [Dichanthelium oligosanthes]